LFYDECLYETRVNEIIAATVKGLMCEPVDTVPRVGVK